MDGKIIFGEYGDLDMGAYASLEQRIRYPRDRAHQMHGAGSSTERITDPTQATSNVNLETEKSNSRVRMNSSTFKNIIVENEFDREIKKFNLIARRYVFKFKDFGGNSDPVTWLKV